MESTIRSTSADDIATKIRRAVADATLPDTIVRRVATAAADGLISRSELARQLGYINESRMRGKVRNSAAYFVTCAKDLFRMAGLPWSADERSLGHERRNNVHYS